MLRQRILDWCARQYFRIGRCYNAFAAALHNLESAAGRRSIILSDVFGADVYQRRRQADAEQHEMPAQSSASYRWDAMLDFSPPTSGGSICPSQQRDGGAPLQAPMPSRRSGAAKQIWNCNGRGAHILAVLLATVVILICIGAVRSDTAPLRRNLDADSVAERFSHPETEARNGAAGNGFAPAGFSSEVELMPRRVDFAPRLGGLYAPGENGDDLKIQTPDSVVDAAGTSPADINGALPSSDVSLIMVRNLPAGTTLSAGKRVSATGWALARADLDTVVVTLPAGHPAKVGAMIELFNMAGSQTGTMTVEIREQRLKPVVAARRARAARNPRGPANQQATTKSGFQKTGQTQTAPAAPAEKTTLFLALPFLPGPTGTPSANPGTTVGQQILIGLGVIPSNPVANLAPKN